MAASMVREGDQRGRCRQGVTTLAAVDVLAGIETGRGALVVGARR
jgi:hypothetical protein